ncbi:MAG: hypothetical protein LBK53_05705 [Heliobacteriaceae bacterium]|nr:hypothetical protein [Heliobacteriaceae bacterium]
MIIEKGGMVMRETFKDGCNADVVPLSGGGGGAFKWLLSMLSPNFFN